MGKILHPAVRLVGGKENKDCSAKANTGRPIVRTVGKPWQNLTP